MNITAGEVLGSYAHPSRQQMARARGLEYKLPREALLKLLIPRLYNPVAIRTALAELASTERHLLDQLILLGGEAPTELLRSVLEREGRVEPRPEARDMWTSVRSEKGSPWVRDSRKFEDLIARLGVLGLAYSGNSTLGGAVELSSPGRRLFIPDEVLRHLPPMILAVETTSAPALVRPADPAAALRDVYMLLSVAAEGPIPLIARGLIAKRALVRIAGLLRVPEAAAIARSEDDLPRLSLLRALAEEQRLLVSRQSALAPGENVPDFLALPAGERRLRLFEDYRATALWCELFHLPGIAVRSSGSRRPAPAPIVAARRRVLDEIAQLPAERWIALEHLSGRLRCRAYEFLLPRHWPSRTSYLGYAAKPDLYGGDNSLGWVFEGAGDEQQGWSAVEGGVIRLVVQALHWLGVVDAGFAGETATAFRVTADGVQLLRGEAPRPAAAAAPNVVIQPNFQVFAFAPTDEGVLFRLDQVAERVRAEQAVEYRLTRESVYRAQRAGWEVPDILRFLEEVSTVALPQNVRRSIEEWGAELERVVVHRGAALLQAADASTLDALAADPALAPLLVRRPAPTAALIPRSGLDALYAGLLERGHLASLSEGTDEPPGPQIGLEASGQVGFRHAVPSIYVLAALRAFTEGDPAALRLTTGRLRRAAREGETPEEILETLEAYNSGPLPPELVTLVRHWAKDWGGSALSEVTLLQVEQAAALADLLADAAVKRYLQPLPGSSDMAVVRLDGVAAVRAALEARGMAISARLLR